MVSIIVLTYNQENTIGRTLDSILKQETQYPYEIIIGDDCSKDSTRSICEKYQREYPDKVKLNEPHDNYGVVRNYIDTLRRCKGKYIMECAGDDWWHNPQKIELQVSFMEGSPNCVVLHSGFDEYHVATNTTVIKKPIPTSKDQFVSVIRRNPVCAPTVCIRKSAMDAIHIDSFVDLGFMVEDYPSWLALSTQGDICTMEQSLATYSIYPGSIHNIRDYNKRVKYIDNFHQMRNYYAEKNGRLNVLRNVLDTLYYTQKAETAIQYGVRKDAIEAYRRINNKDRKTRIKSLMVRIPFFFSYINKKYNKGLY